MGMKPRPAQRQDLKKASDRELFMELTSRGYRLGLDRGRTEMFYMGGKVVPYHSYDLMVPTDSWFTEYAEENG